MISSADPLLGVVDLCRDWLVYVARLVRIERFLAAAELVQDQASGSGLSPAIFGVGSLEQEFFGVEELRGEDRGLVLELAGKEFAD